MAQEAKYLGVGVGLRRAYFDSVFSTSRRIDWLEIVTENFMDFGGRPRRVLEKAKDRWPVSCHGVGLSLGSVDPLRDDYLDSLKRLVEFADVPWFSDHLCFSSANGHYYHDLIPLLRTGEVVEHVADRMKRVMDAINRPLAIENISYYADSRHNQLAEAEFIDQVLRRSGGWLLLDINNVYVNSRNFGGDPREFIDALPLDRVVQVHLAGHWDRGDVVIDTHGDRVCEEVWDLFGYFLGKAGRPVSTLIEWDNDLPRFDELLDQADRARAMIEEAYPNAAQ